VLAPKLGQFAREYPDVALEITTDDNRMDLVAGRFDAGIHLGDFLERDMIAVRVSPDQPIPGSSCMTQPADSSRGRLPP
jgi:DNA-binding transcriptional LysR family regulator